MSALELASQARKRARTEDGDKNATEPDTVRSQDFYFNDGTIVLRTLSKKKNQYTLFRVHKSLLALHCTVFRDMLGDGDTMHFENASEECDGVPLMHLHDDFMDVDDFLRALYQPEFMHRHTNLDRYDLQMSDFPEMYSRSMVLAKKCGAEKLIDVFSDALRQTWPSEWNKNEAVLKGRAAIVDTREDIRPNTEEIHKFSPNPVWTIRMAVDLDIPDVLPCAFVALCARLGPGTSVTDMEGEGELPDDIDDCTSVLTATELLCLITGGRSMASYVYEYVTEHPTIALDAFTIPRSDGHTCYRRFQTSWKALKETLESVWGAFLPFRVLRTALDGSNLCESCHKDARFHINEIELDLWQKLPVFFKLKQYGVEDGWGS
ncbi:hypothetical protein PENSPDRAFT_747407 [Peniophora sp. CONT]|nr:hypothetical protein PENSPDRAFT_747407 [Peniophora sp. CONT]